MKKKLLLLIILLIPFIVFAEKQIAEHKIDNYIGTYIDNDTRYVMTSYDKMYVLDKQTGELYTKKFNGGDGIFWLNYDYENIALSSKPSTHYLVLDQENRYLYLLDSKLNEIKKSEMFDAWISDYFIKDNKLYIIGGNNNEIAATVYDIDLNLIKETYLEIDYWPEPFYDEAMGLIRDYDSPYIYKINNNNEIEQVENNIGVYSDGGYLVSYDIEEDTDIDEVKVTDNYISQVRPYGNYYYVLYKDNNDELILAKYNEDLDLIKEKNLYDELGIIVETDDYGIYPVNGKLTFWFSFTSGNEVNYEVDEDLNLTYKTNLDLCKGNYYSYEDLTTLFNPYSVDILKFQKSLEKIYNNIYNSEENFIVERISHYKQIDNKLYAVIPKIEFTESSIDVTVNFYVYNEQDKLEKKTKITTIHFDDESELETLLDVFNGISYINNKLVYYQKMVTIDEDSELDDITKYYELDKSGNLIGEIEEPIYFKDAYTLTSYTLTGGNELLFQITSDLRSSCSTRSSSCSIRTSTNRTTTNIRTRKENINKERSENLMGYDNKITIKLIKNTNDITINSLNGEVKLSNTNPGEEVTLNITPKDGYKVKNIKITTKDGEVIEVKDNKFIMPNDDIIIDVEYEEDVVINPYTLDAIIVVISISIISLVAFIYNKKKTAYLK